MAGSTHEVSPLEQSTSWSGTRFKPRLIKETSPSVVLDSRTIAKDPFAPTQKAKGKRQKTTTSHPHVPWQSYHRSCATPDGGYVSLWYLRFCLNAPPPC